MRKLVMLSQLALVGILSLNCDDLPPKTPEDRMRSELYKNPSNKYWQTNKTFGYHNLPDTMVVIVAPINRSVDDVINQNYPFFGKITHIQRVIDTPRTTVNTAVGGSGILAGGDADAGTEVGPLVYEVTLQKNPLWNENNFDSN